MLAVCLARKIKMSENSLEKFLLSLKERELLRWGQGAWVLTWWRIALILISIKLWGRLKFYKINNFLVRNIKLILTNSYTFLLKISKKLVQFYNTELRSEQVLEWQAQLIIRCINFKSNKINNHKKFSKLHIKRL